MAQAAVTAPAGAAVTAYVPVVMMGYAVPCSMVQAAVSPASGADLGVDSDGRTTICFRNVPNNYTIQNVLDLLDSRGFRTYYDFLYLPHDFKRLPSLVNVGYFFVNFTSCSAAKCAWNTFDNFQDWSLNSDKVLKATWANETQGIKMCIARYWTSPVMHKNIPTVCKPLILIQGRLVPLRPAKKKVREPRLKSADECQGDDQALNGESYGVDGASSCNSAVDTTICVDFQEDDSHAPAPCEGDELAKGSDEEDEKARPFDVTSSSSAWVLDSDAPACYLCNMAFTWMRRRHHCRSCGQVCCAVCAPLTSGSGHVGLLRLPRDEPAPTFKRLCMDCVDKVEWSSDAPSGTHYQIKNTFFDTSIKEDERRVVTFPY